ncbi:MAG: MATE family efflux transporter [Bacillota bacterium]|nr:MATE family efflux transporter [Bacillota bacterium]
MNKNELGTESVGRLLLKFSIPAVVGMLVNVLYSIVDRIFVGQYVGAIQLSGVAVTMPISNVIMAFGMLAGIGASALVSIKLGQHKTEEAEKALGNAFSLLIIFSILLTVAGIIFLEPILRMLGASPVTMPYAKQFAFIIILGLMFQNVSMGLNNIIRAQGNPGIAMTTMLIGAALNFTVNPLLIFVFKLGVRGSALSTVISQFVTTAWTLLYFTRSGSLLRLKLKNMRLEMGIIKQIVAIGMSAFTMQLAASLVTVTFNSGLERYGGDLAIGAMALVNSVAMLVLMPIFGINQGVQPIIGYNYGAKNYHRVKEALKYAVMAATVITTVGFIFIELFPGQIIRVFNNNSADLISMGTRGLAIFHVLLPIVGFTIVCTNYFTAVAKAKLSMLLGLLRQVIVLIPLIIILPKFFRLDGIWMAQPCADFITTVITALFIVTEMRKLNTQAAEEADDKPLYMEDCTETI